MFEASNEQYAVPQRLSRTVDWLKAREKPLVCLGVAFQMLVLVGMIATRAAPHLTGQTVLLRVVPVDPRDMFRGDYVILGYEFSRPGRIPGLPTNAYGPEWQGRTVYVTLAPEADGVHWRPDKYGLTPPTSGKYLRGTLGRGGRLEFGIESYYVQEGKGRMYEDAMRSRRLWAEVSVAPNGQAALRSLRIE